MLGIASVTVFMSAPGQSFSVAAFVDPMLAELGVARTGYSLAYMTATLIGGCMLPFVGRLVDRCGARMILPVVAIGLGLACGWMSRLQSIVGLYVGFTLIRCLGQGSLTLISNWIIGEWFQARRGLAAGLCAVGGTASVLVIPQINNLFIEQYGWRNTWLILGGIVCTALVVPTIVFLRDRPEPLGLLPDWKFTPLKTVDTSVTSPSEDEPAAQKDAVASREERDFTAGEAIRCLSFWKVASVVATVSLVGTGLMFHQVSILAEQGVDRPMALSALGVQAIAATCSTLLAGVLIDHMPARFVLACSMALEVCAISLLIKLPQPGWVYVYSTLLGFHGGIIRSAGSVVWINFFGRKHQGAIQGIAMSIMVFAAALGPVPAALAKDVSGSYTIALWGFMVLPITAGIAVLSAGPPVHPSADALPS